MGGIVAKMRLAARTGVTSAAAPQTEDSEALLARFESQLERLRREFAVHDRGTDVVAGRAPPEVLRGFLVAYGDLMSQRALLLDRLDETIQRVDETSARQLQCARVSVWVLDRARTKISCRDLFERDAKKHSSGLELARSAFPTYFEALEHERTIAAHQAQLDPRTSCFTESYLKPNGITSMLDVPVWASGRMIGVVCHEHVGPARTWNADEEQFAYLVSSFLAMAFERAG